MPFFADHATRGAVSGKIGISALHRTPEIHGNLTVDDLKVGRETAGQVELTFDAKDQRAPPRFKSAARLPVGPHPTCTPKRTGLAGLPTTFAQPSTRRRRWKWRSTLRDSHLLHCSRSPKTSSSGRAGHSKRTSKLWALRASHPFLRDSRHREVQRHPDATAGHWPRAQGLSAEVTADGAGAVRVNKVAGEIGAGTFTGSNVFSVSQRTSAARQGQMHVPAGRAVPVHPLRGSRTAPSSGDVFAEANLDHDLFKLTSMLLRWGQDVRPRGAEVSSRSTTIR